MNRVIKRDLVRSMTLPQFAEYLQNLVRAQLQEIMLAIVLAFEVYELKPEYVDIAGFSQMEFYQKNDQQWTAAIKKFNEVKPIPRSMLPKPSYTPEETSVMHRSNCSASIPPSGHPRGHHFSWVAPVSISFYFSSDPGAARGGGRGQNNLTCV